MTTLEKLNHICDTVGVQCMTGDLEGNRPDSPPDRYVVLVPISDNLDEYSDDRPAVERNSVLLSIYSKTNYRVLRTQLRDAILAEGLSITGMAYIEHETDTGYYHYEIDVEDITTI